jgi:hypothetical protein
MLLNPDRYRTQICIQGPACNRKVCFFAHTPEQLCRPPAAPVDGRRPSLDTTAAPDAAAASGAAPKLPYYYSPSA